MRKAKNFKNQNRAIAEHNSIAQIQSRKFLDENEKYIFYAIIGSIETHTTEYLKKFIEENNSIEKNKYLIEPIKKMEKLKNTCLNFNKKIQDFFKDITEEKIKLGMISYIKLLGHFREKNYKIEKIEKLNDKYKEEKDLKVYYLELNYAYHIMKAILEEGKINQDWINKYFHYWQIQLRAVANWIEKEINSIDVKTA